MMRRSSRRLTLGVSHEFPVNKKITQGTRLRGSEALLKQTEKELGKSVEPGQPPLVTDVPPRPHLGRCRARGANCSGPMSNSKGLDSRSSRLCSCPFGLCRSERSYSSLSAWGETWAGYEKEGRGRIR